MFFSPFRMLSRTLLAASLISLGCVSLAAQDMPAAPTPAKHAMPAGTDPSRVDIFLGYSYYSAHGVVKPAGISYSSVNLGAIGSVAYYMNRYVGFEGVYGAHPDGNNDGLYFGTLGMIARYPTPHFTPFIHGGAGASTLGGPNSDAGGYHEPYRWGPGLRAGVGADLNFGRFGWRVFQADYTYNHANYNPGPQFPPTPGRLGGRTDLSGIELSTGLLMHFGHIIPPPPVTYTCAASPMTVYPGDPVTVTGTPTNLNPKHEPAYTWSSDAGKVSGTSSTANVATDNVQPGTYTVKGTVSQGKKPGEFADCTAQYTVQPFQPPTVTCSAAPSTVNPGDASTITAMGASPQNRPLTYSYSASAGSVSGSSSTATLSTSGVAPGTTVSVTCNVVDDKGQTASGMISVMVSAPAAPAPTASNLCTVSFSRDKRRPARVDNEGKACLDDVALNLQRNSDAKLVLTGNASEPHGDKLAASRALNTKDYLVKEKGIDSSRITVYTGSAGDKTVTTTLVPSGASYTGGGTVVDESTLHLHPVHHHHAR